MTLAPTDPVFDFTELDVTLSLEDRLALVDQLDLSPIAHSLVSDDYEAPGEMTKEEVIAAIRQYRCALKLWLMFPERNTMLTRMIDEVWHTHILDTAKYVADMVPIFGGYPHHYPYFGSQGPIEEQRRQPASVLQALRGGRSGHLQGLGRQPTRSDARVLPRE